MPTTYGDVITLEDAKAALNIDTDGDDGELSRVVSTASQMWQRRVGPVAASCDEWHDGGSVQIVLRQPPVLTMTSLTESFGPITYTLSPVTLDGGDVAGQWTYSLDAGQGILTRRASGVAQRFTPGARNIHAVYTAGYSTPPADIQHAVTLLCAHLWEMQRSGASFAGKASEMTPGASGSWPPRVEEIAVAYRIPGIA